MLKQDLVQATEQFIRELLEGEGSGHDWWHIHRVRNNALNIAKSYIADLFIVEMAALLHDIADHKLYGGDEEIGPRKAEQWMSSLNISKLEQNHILLIMKEVSFSKGKVPSTLEGKIVQDADRLDAIGAIGIARTFAFGGFKKREIYNPEIPPVKYESLEDYKKNTNPKAPSTEGYDEYRRSKKNSSKAPRVYGEVFGAVLWRVGRQNIVPKINFRSFISLGTSGKPCTFVACQIHLSIFFLLAE